MNTIISEINGILEDNNLKISKTRKNKMIMSANNNKNKKSDYIYKSIILYLSKKEINSILLLRLKDERQLMNIHRDFVKRIEQKNIREQPTLKLY